MPEFTNKETRLELHQRKQAHSPCFEHDTHITCNRKDKSKKIPLGFVTSA